MSEIIQFGFENNGKNNRLLCPKIYSQFKYILYRKWNSSYFVNDPGAKQDHIFDYELPCLSW